MTNGIDQPRDVRGLAVFSYGFRIFFLMAGMWAALSMLIWIITMSNGVMLPSRMVGVDWHMHELVFGYTSAVIAGFLLTAVPNWTGRAPLTGLPLAGLALLWLAGRILIMVSMHLPSLFVSMVDVGFLPVLGLVIFRELAIAKNWRNMPVLALVMVFAIANGLFHYESLTGSAFRAYSPRIGVGAIIMLISLIGGRIIPTFTRNWLAKQAPGRLPAPFDGFDKIVLLISGIAMIAWIAVPEASAIRWLMAVVGILHFFRVSRWAGERTIREPLLAILHIGYLFIPVGYMMVGSDAAVPHAWTAGGIGIVTLAMMTRASLGHVGRPLIATRSITAIYIAVVGSVILRIVAEIFVGSVLLLHLSGTFWMLGFAGFAIVYFPLLTRSKT